MPEIDGFTLAEAIKNDPAIAGATIVMLTSAGQPGDAARCRELGIAAYLPKPIKRSELHAAHPAGARAAAVRHAIGRRSSRATRCGKRATPGASCSSRTTPSTSWSRRRLLERRGHTVVVANNGREALAIWMHAARPVRLRAHGRADAGDGRVRVHRHDPPPGTDDSGAHLPIIAMTAHAMKGDGHAAWQRAWTATCRSRSNRTSSSRSSSGISEPRVRRAVSRAVAASARTDRPPADHEPRPRYLRSPRPRS